MVGVRVCVGSSGPVLPRSRPVGSRHGVGGQITWRSTQQVRVAETMTVVRATRARRRGVLAYSNPFGRGERLPDADAVSGPR